MLVVLRQPPCSLLSAYDKGRMKEVVEESRDGYERWFAKCRSGRYTSTCRGTREYCVILPSVCPEGFSLLFHSHPGDTLSQIFSDADLRTAAAHGADVECIGYEDPVLKVPKAKCVNPKKIDAEKLRAYERALGDVIEDLVRTKSIEEMKEKMRRAAGELVARARWFEPLFDACEVEL